MVVRRILPLVACGAIVLPAQASPPTDPTSGRAVFTGATVPHATSTSLNPAALGAGAAKGLELYVAWLALVQQLAIDHRSLDVTTGALSAPTKIRDTQASPGGMVGVLWHPSERLTLGFEARVPPAEFAPEGYDALRYHALLGKQRDYLATLGVSLRVTSAFYFGASLSHDNTFLRLRYARDTALAAGTGPAGITSDCGGAPCGVENPEASELYDLDVASRWLATSNLKVHIGTVFRVYPGVWIGLAYHTPPGFDVQASLPGHVDVTRAPRDGGETIRGDAEIYISYPASVDGEVRARLPRDLELHVGGRWEDLSRMQAYDVRTFGSTFRANNIPEWTMRARGLHDSFALWAGVEQRDTGEHPLRFGGRLGFQTSAVDADRTSPLTIATAAFTLDGGVQWRLAPTWVVQLSYGLSFYPTVSVPKSAFDPRYSIECIESGYDYTNVGCEAARNGYAIPSAAGDYRRIEHWFRLGFRYDRP